MDWFPDWFGETCAIVASGPSVDRSAIESLKGNCRVVVINNGLTLAPWADMLYAADGKWWDANPEARSFEGLKVTPDLQASLRYKQLKLINLVTGDEKRENRISLERGVIGRGGNSAFQALNLCVQFGAKTIVMHGFDFCGEHWHGPHPRTLRNPRPSSLAKWAAVLDAEAASLKMMGIEVLNASEISVLKNYQRVSARWTTTRPTLMLQKCS
jgi:hypothetical protein